MEERSAAYEPITRPSVAALDAILGEPFRVLDDGFVRVVDYLGDDTAIVQAARVSYGKGTKRVQQDRALIRYLMRHSHTTPFEMCEIKLHVRVPMDTWRQWIRHRTASVNEYSTRYSEAIDAAQRTAADAWRLQTTANRQGSAGTVSADLGAQLTEQEGDLQRLARSVYSNRIAAGVAREQARKDLPLSTYTEAYWKIDLHNLLHFLALRMDVHAQLEIREYATVIGEQIVSRWVPVAWQAFLDYRVHGTVLSGLETGIVQALAAGDATRATVLVEEAGLLERTPEGEVKPNFERREIEEKLRGLGWTAPWSGGR
ncbi:MAG: FAD-dependent thymidylate synthase [Acidobacteria bacterium]|nr:MAG: FAD-dependent thymidylate synthase [Acidobacteriota bacterium]